MDYKEEFDIFSFRFWGGARDRVGILRAGRMLELEQHIIECFDGETPTSGEINDFVWFGCEDFFGEFAVEDEE